jgi:hypothetical protein
MGKWSLAEPTTKGKEEKGGRDQAAKRAGKAAREGGGRL